MNQNTIVKGVKQESEKWSGVMKDAGEALKDSAKAARSVGEDIVEDAQEKGGEALMHARGWARQNPLLAILSGAALGALAIRLLGARRE